MFVLRVLSELSLVLLVQETDGTAEDEETEENKERREEGERTAEGRDDGSSCNQILALVTKSLLPRLVGLFLNISLTVSMLSSSIFCLCRNNYRFEK